MALVDFLVHSHLDRIDVPPLIPAVGLACLVLLGLTYRRRQSKQTLKRLPGPPGYPFIGNLLQLVGAERPHLLFPEWNRKYGALQPAIVTRRRINGYFDRGHCSILHFGFSKHRHQ